MQIELIPQALKDIRQWVCWLYMSDPENPDKKPRKVPINPKNGKPAKSNDADTWGSFDDAVWGLKQFKAIGIGIMFANNLCGVDIDDCVKDDGNISEMADDIVDILGSYNEFSPSGTGLHILCFGQLPPGRRRDDNIGLEMYDNGRFFTVTGNVYKNEYDLIQAENALQRVHAKYMPDKPQNNTAVKPIAVFGGISLSDNEILEKAFNAQNNGSKFKALYNGDISGYQSQSSADQAFCNMLAFWFGKDTGRMDTVFRSSGLFRRKWDERRGHDTYGGITLNEAINGCQQVYEPKKMADKVQAIGTPLPPKVEGLPISVDDIPQQDGVNTYYSWDDTGNAQRFHNENAGDIKYNHIEKKWLIWDGKRWAADETAEVKRRADKMLFTMSIEARDMEGMEAQFRRHLQRSRSSKGKCAFIEETKHLEGVPILPAELDRYPSAFNAKNGVVSLKTGKIKEHSRDWLLTKIGNADYIKDTKCPRWIKFLNDITQGDENLMLYLQRMVGYCLTAATTEQCIFFLYGVGSNGKSTFIDVISHIMGDYTKHCQPETIMLKDKTMAASGDIARLRGARLVTTGEPKDGCKLDEGIVKQLTGDDIVTARFLYASEFEFKPEFKIMMSTNYKPIIKGTDEGIWRRIKIIPFTVNFSDDKKDKNLKSKLMSEKTGIFSWCVDGAVGWYAHGLPPCPLVDGATKEYRQEMDSIQQFVDDCIESFENTTVQSVALYNCYCLWSTKQGIRYPISATKFSLEMKKRFKWKKSRLFNEFIGICLSEEGSMLMLSKD